MGNTRMNPLYRKSSNKVKKEPTLRERQMESLKKNALKRKIQASIFAGVATCLALISAPQSRRIVSARSSSDASKLVSQRSNLTRHSAPVQKRVRFSDDLPRAVSRFFTA